jgi:methylated-DNA-[protein]-cysteine S-methyltransferase
MQYAITKTNVGWVGIGIEGGAICYASIAGAKEDVLDELAARGATERAKPSEAAPLVDLMQRAAAGEDVPVNGQVKITGGTPFQRDVWKALLKIPHGATTSYGELAMRVGRPGAARAVGQAVGSNPVPVLIPCHRVLASDGTLGGFGGGLPMKKTLLRQEGISV